MSGRFAALKPASDEERQKLWDKNINKIRSLIKEIDTDVFDGQGEIEENKESFFSIAGFNKPNIVAYWNGNFEAIAVCPINASTLRVIVFKYVKGSQARECEPEDLETLLESAVRILVKK